MHLKAGFFQVGDYGWYQRDAPFFRVDFPWYAKDHAPSFQKAFEIDAVNSRLDIVFLIALQRIRTLVSGCELQLRLFNNVLAESGAERVPLFWERLLSSIRHAPLKSAGSNRQRNSISNAPLGTRRYIAVCKTVPAVRHMVAKSSLM
jgi:hypothetical protein